MACFLLFTFFPLLPLFKLPFFRLCIARLTDFRAPFPYRAIVSSTSSYLLSCGHSRANPRVEAWWYVLCRLYKP